MKANNQSLKRVIIFLFAAIVCSHLYAADGDEFYANTVEDVNMLFKVLSEKEKTCAVGSIKRATKGAITIPSSANGYSVTSIGTYAFQECSSLTSVTIPNSVIGIEHGAFIGCSGLTNITIPNSVTSIGDYAFHRSGLTSITIPNSVTNIGSYAFYTCESLTSITIPNSVTSIGAKAFHLTQWYDNQPDGLIYIGKVAYKYKGTMPADTSIEIYDGTTCVSGYAFEGYRDLTSITIPNSMTSIGNSAFSCCSGLTSVIIPNSVTSIGDYAFGSCNNLTSVTINSNTILSTTSHYQDINMKSLFGNQVKEYVLGSDITTIGEDAFYGCSGMTSITIPKSVTKIGDDAFRGCDGLQKVVINDIVSWCRISFADTYSNPLYYAHHLYNSEDKEIKDLVIPDEITTIGEKTFYGCSGLTSVTLPNSVISIGFGAFYECSGLTNVTIPNSMKYIGSHAFYKCSVLANITIPNSVTSIGSSAFCGCSGLTSITIPNSVTSIGDYAFGSCNNLTSVTINSNTILSFNIYDKDMVHLFGNQVKEYILGNDVTNIGSNAFYQCSGLTSIIFSNSLTSIGDYAFAGCRGLTSITIPNSVTSVGSNAFEDTQWYDNQPDGLIYIGKIAYKYKGDMPVDTSIEIYDGTIGISGSAFAGYTGLANITIPNSVNNIGGYAFSGCSGLTNIIIPNSVTNIGGSAFSSCSGLTNIIIPNSVTNIGGSAFSGCSGLTNITIPNSVTVIGGGAFYNCSGLTSITIPNSVTSIGYSAFRGCKNLTSIISYIKIPFEMSDEVFESSVKAKATLSVPYRSKVRYEQTDGWKDFSYIAERETTLGDIFTSKTDENVDMWFMITDLEKVICQVGIDSDGKTAIDKTTKGVLTIPATANGFNVTEIGSAAFAGCDSLTSIFIPNTVNTIAKNSFAGCTGLSNIVVDANNTVYDSRDNSNAIIETASNTLLVGSGNTVLPATVTAIADSAFYGMTGLTSIKLPASLKNIGVEAFSHADQLASVRSEIVEPFAIPTTAFVHSNGETPVLFVPWDSKEKYQSAEGWSQFAQMIELAPSDGFEFAAESDGVMLHFKVTDREKRKCQVELTEQNAAHITIPREVRDQTVTAISDRAFANCTELLSISFPETATAAGNHVLEDCGSLAAIRWDANVEIPVGLTEDVSNPNLLLYVKDKDYAPSSIQNVVSNGVAESIVLKDATSGNNFYCTEQFTAKRITYTHHYSMTSGYKECKGWETIALPFDVVDITHESNAELSPISLWEVDSSKRPFWLYEQTEAGWQSAKVINANTPYIICMPNNEHYETTYNISGNIVFSASDVTVHASDNLVSSKRGQRNFVPNYQNTDRSSDIYALNVNNLWSTNTDSNLAEGSAFIRDSRNVRPFEAYMTIDSGDGSTRSISIFDDDDVTGIMDLPLASKNKDGVIRVYSLSGILLKQGKDEKILNDLPKGAFIVNGKKIIK